MPKYWPKAHSMKNIGTPAKRIVMMYGTKKAPTIVALKNKQQMLHHFLKLLFFKNKRLILKKTIEIRFTTNVNLKIIEKVLAGCGEIIGPGI